MPGEQSIPALQARLSGCQRDLARLCVDLQESTTRCSVAVDLLRRCLKTGYLRTDETRELFEEIEEFAGPDF